MASGQDHHKFAQTFNDLMFALNFSEHLSIVRGLTKQSNLVLQNNAGFLPKCITNFLRRKLSLLKISDMIQSHMYRCVIATLRFQLIKQFSRIPQGWRDRATRL